MSSSLKQERERLSDTHSTYIKLKSFMEEFNKNTQYNKKKKSSFSKLKEELQSFTIENFKKLISMVHESLSTSNDFTNKEQLVCSINSFMNIFPKLTNLIGKDVSDFQDFVDQLENLKKDVY